MLSTIALLPPNDRAHHSVSQRNGDPTHLRSRSKTRIAHRARTTVPVRPLHEWLPIFFRSCTLHFPLSVGERKGRVRGAAQVLKPSRRRIRYPPTLP